MYRFKSASIPPELDMSAIMNGHTGTEGRFASRFVKFAGTSETFTKSIDVAGQAIDDLRQSSGMIQEQKKGIDKLFLLSERAIQAISLLEKESGVHQVDNIPLPSDPVRQSYGKKMGYVSLAISFLNEGLLHFMEETINLQTALDSRDRTISQLAGQIPSVELIGAFEEIALNDLVNTKPVDVASYAKQEKPVSPVEKLKPKKK
jgi:hypothetical protein